MSDNFRHCPECNTANEPEYSFCKNCGAPLPKENAKKDNPYGYADPYGGSPYGNGYGAVPPVNPYSPFYAEEIDGIPTEDLVRFVGKNSDKIVGKWSHMAVTHSKISWCWPVAILTFLFGIAGAAFWFLYRRMYKIGIILLAASLLLTGVQSFLLVTPMQDVFNTVLSAATEYGDEITESQAAELVEQMAEDADLASVSVMSNLFSLIKWAGLILLSMFALPLYKNFAVGKIRAYGRRPNDMELLLSGGTSGGAVAIGVVLNIMLSTAIFVSASVAIISTIFAAL